VGVGREIESGGDTDGCSRARAPESRGKGSAKNGKWALPWHRLGSASRKHSWKTGQLISISQRGSRRMVFRGRTVVHFPKTSRKSQNNTEEGGKEEGGGSFQFGKTKTEAIRTARGWSRTRAADGCSGEKNYAGKKWAGAQDRWNGKATCEVCAIQRKSRTKKAKLINFKHTSHDSLNRPGMRKSWRRYK